MQWKQVKAQQFVINEQKQQHLHHYKKTLHIYKWIFSTGKYLSFFGSDSSSELIY
jgi:hypothetical protein